MDDARVLLSSVVHDVYGACPERDELLVLPSLQGGWEALYQELFPKELLWWFIKKFTTTEECQQAWRVWNTPHRYFLDVARLHHATTGEAIQLPPTEFVERLQRRLVAALHPSARKLVVTCNSRQAREAVKVVSLRTTEETWRGA